VVWSAWHICSVACPSGVSTSWCCTLRLASLYRPFPAVGVLCWILPVLSLQFICRACVMFDGVLLCYAVELCRQLGVVSCCCSSLCCRGLGTINTNSLIQPGWVEMYSCCQNPRSNVFDCSKAGDSAAMQARLARATTLCSVSRMPARFSCVQDCSRDNLGALSEFCTIPLPACVTSIPLLAVPPSMPARDKTHQWAIHHAPRLPAAAICTDGYKCRPADCVVSAQSAGPPTNRNKRECTHGSVYAWLRPLRLLCWEGSSL
jgi:hypothetical protein